MMKKNTPNVRPADPGYDSFENGLADLRGILNRSAAAEEPRDYPRDDPYQGKNRRYRDENDRRPQERFYPGEEDDGDLRDNGYASQNAASPYPASGAYGYADEGEPYEEDYESQPLSYDGWPLRRKSSVSLRILLGVVAAAAVAVLFALFTSDATRAIIANAKEAILPERQDRAAPPEPAETQLTAGDLELKDPARFAAPSFQSIGQRGTTSAVAAAPRENVATAYSASPSAYQGNGSPYQGAPQSRGLPATQPFAPPQAAAPADAPSSLGSIGGTVARRLAPDELSNLMRRARSLLAAGDIPSARLLLERAADAQEAGAAFLLAETYDPVVLGTQDARRIVPDPAAARTWYERAAQLGSVEAQRRLGQLPN
ncbi:MAG TPA: hypothetical protein VMM15_32360 [Bradyrhizobium sp.]|nr:hypothetical protein [Bradyrhizobium sp.]